MMFVYPTFLWALLAVSIPIIIHLFNFRRYKKVYFTNVRFLKELQQESKSKSRLKEILILLARCLAVACLVLAFAQPVISQGEAVTKPGANAVSIYIDNSFSMENVQKQGPLLDIARRHAREIVKIYGGADKFQLITNDFEGRHQRFYGKEDIIDKIDEVKISPAVRNYADVLKRQHEFLNSSGLQNKKVYSLTDAQKTTFNFSEIPSDTTVKTVILPLAANQVNNLFLDSCWFETPLQQKGFIQKLHARIQNKGNNAISAGSAKLFLNGRQLAISSFSAEPYSAQEIRFSFELKESGFNFGSIKIEDYPITFDDELFFAFNSQISINVTLINGTALPPDNPFEALFRADSLFTLNSFSEQSVDYGKFKSTDVIILNQPREISSGLLSELGKFIRQGGSVVLVPARDADLVSYNNFLTTFNLPQFSDQDTSSLKTDKIETGSVFFSGVFEKIDERINLPLVNRHYKTVSAARSNFETLLALQNGDPLLGRVSVQDGMIYLFTSPMDQRSTNFARHALFVPTIYRICFSSLKNPQLSYEVNTNTVLQIRNQSGTGDQPPHIRHTTKGTDVIPEVRAVENGLLLYTRGQISQPGFYELLRAEDRMLPLAFNYSRKESDLSSWTPGEVADMVKDKGWKNLSVVESTGEEIGARLIQEENGTRLWKLFIILALAFIIIEILLLRFLK